MAHLTEGSDKIAIAGALVLGRQTGEGHHVLSDPSTSREHARITHRAGVYVLEDLGSRNGTMLNGTIIRAPETLKHGDQIRIGTHTFTFANAETAAAHAPASPPAHKTTASFRPPVPLQKPTTSRHPAAPAAAREDSPAPERRRPVRTGPSGFVRFVAAIFLLAVFGATAYYGHLFMARFFAGKPLF